MAQTKAESNFSKNWRELVIENPMAIEINRFRRRFLEGGRGKSVNTMVLVVAILAYASLLLVIANMSGDFPPVVLIYMQTALFALISPALMYSAISGEREKRSWDLLLVAPITHAQIVVGKFLAALAGITVTFVLFLLPTLFTAITYKGDYSYGSGSIGTVSGTYALIAEEAISLTFGICVAALTLLFSARCKRSLMALGVVLTLNFLALIAFPSLFAMMSNSSSSGEFLFLAHPIFAIMRLDQLSHYRGSYYSSFDSLDGIWYGLPQTLLYLAFTAVFIVWAVKTVNFADGEKKFIPRKINA